MKITTILTTCAAMLTMMGCASNPVPLTPTISSTGDLPHGTLTAASCEGLPAEAVGAGFFSGARKPVAVEPLRGELKIGARNSVTKPVGARVVIEASPSMTAAYLERVVDCHADSYRATGVSAGDEPLSVPGAKVSVVQLRGGYGIDIKHDDMDGAKEIYARASTLRK